MEKPKYNEQEALRLLRDPETSRRGFELLVIHFSPILYAQIRRMVTDHDDTDDLLQNTFIKAWTSLDSFRGDSHLSTWLYRIAMNECLTFLQKKQSQITISLDDPDANEVAQVEGDVYYSADEIQQKFQQALNTLPEKQRAVFNLKYFQEMKYEEMSQVLNTSVGALKASYHIAVEKIAKILRTTD